jgi:predicted ATP-dependent endonuclease of OLD family
MQEREKIFMKIKAFRIKNYRSIKDSGTCYLSGDNITILAGKNESGKTAILEALEDFSVGREIRKEAIPYHDKEAKPEIAVTFEIDADILKELWKKIGFEIQTRQEGEIREIEITKRYPTNYFLSEESLLKLSMPILGEKAKEFLELYRLFSDFISNFPDLHIVELPGIPHWGETISIFQTEMAKVKSDIESFKSRIQSGLVALSEVTKNDFSRHSDELIKKIAEMENIAASVQSRIVEEIKKWIPNFILFISFEDIFPSEVPLNQATNNKLIKDLDIISDLRLDVIISGAIADKTKHKEQLNVRLKDDYEKFWTQDLTNLHIEWDNVNLYFLIKEEEDFYPPNLRSKGKQWHLAFYVRVAARAREEVPNIILIDEPGLFLHAKAQADVLKRLEDSAEHAPIIFSTHSPYLIRTDKLNRIRLLLKTPAEGSIISNKIHKGADKETLTPIITAIGLDLSAGLDIAKNNNVLTEGITDYYYLLGFKELLNFDFEEEVRLIPCVGAGKFEVLVPLLMGWGLNHCVVLDNDDQGKKIKKKLLKEFEHTGIKIIPVSENEGDEIEDLFDRGDFIRYVLNEEPNKFPSDRKNSEIIKEKGKKYDTALLSKLFFENIKDETISISEKTKINFKNLFERINKSMFQND